VATRPREGLFKETLRRAADSRRFLFLCGFLAFAGTVSVSYPVTAVVMPAALVSPRRWQSIALSSALGSALGATVLVLVFFHVGWARIYQHYPEFASHPTWQEVLGWVSDYGIAALFVIATLPLPQTPALVFFGIVRPEPFAVFLAILGAKAIKYGIFAWIVSRFPGRFAGGLRGLLGLVKLRGKR
jgi:membrane protein YqaA with SNARE-associated domain